MTSEEYNKILAEIAALPTINGEKTESSIQEERKTAS